MKISKKNLIVGVVVLVAIHLVLYFGIVGSPEEKAQEKRSYCAELCDYIDSNELAARNANSGIPIACFTECLNK